MKIYLEKILTGSSTFVLGLFMRYIATTQIKELSLTGVSPRAVPLLVANGVILFSLIIVLKGLLLYFTEKKSGNFTLSQIQFTPFPFLIFSIMVLYGVGMNYLGYFLSSFIVLSLLLYLLKVRKIKSYLTIYGLIIFIYVVIDLFLKIRLPKLGLWGII